MHTCKYIFRHLFPHPSSFRGTTPETCRHLRNINLFISMERFHTKCVQIGIDQDRTHTLSLPFFGSLPLQSCKEKVPLHIQVLPIQNYVHIFPHIVIKRPYLLQYCTPILILKYYSTYQFLQVCYIIKNAATLSRLVSLVYVYLHIFRFMVNFVIQ